MSSPPPKHSLSSPTSGNAPQPVLPTPSSSTSVSIRHNPAMLRQELERQLVEKQRQLQESHSGIGKNVLARQVNQLQDKLRDLDAVAKDSESAPSSERLRSLERDFTTFRSHPLSPGMSSLRNKEKLLSQRSTGLDPLPSPTTSTLLPPAHDSTSLLPLPPPPTGSTPTKRRSKVPNADRRNTDIEFATEIGQGLLLEVRKMQALLQEKEEKLRALETQKADLERAAEAMTKQMRQREENEEKLKEETWNLELAKQELTISVTELQQNLNKANVEQNRLAKQVGELRSDIEHLRDREEKLNFTMDNMKQRHEQDMSSIRRHAAAVQREKSEQSKHIEALNSELAIAKAQSRIGKHIHPESEPTARSEQPDDQTQSVLAVNSDASPSSSPPPSPKQSPRNQAMEVETLKTSLAHAHRMVHNLRSNLLKEKTEKFEFKKLLAESQETIEVLQNDHSMWVDTHPRNANSATPDSKRSFKGSGALTPKRRGLRKNRSGMARTLDDSETDSRRRRRRKVSSTTADNDSVYSYSSMSELSEESSAESDTESPTSIKDEIGFTSLSSELSSSQKAPIVVDAQVNTEPVETPRSLGDELGMAMSMPPSEQENTVQHAVSREINTPKDTTEMSTQTNDEPEIVAVEGITQTTASEPIESCIQTDTIVISQTDMLIQTDTPSLTDSTLSSMSASPILSEWKMVSLPAFECEPEDPVIAQAALAAAIAADRARVFESGVHTSIQSEPEDPHIAQAAMAAAVASALAAHKSHILEKSVDSSTQFDPEVAESTMQSVFAEYRAEALGKAVSFATQSDDMKVVFDEYRQQAMAEGTTMGTQSEPEDPTIAQAALATAVAEALTVHRANALEASVDTAVQSEPEDPKIAQDALEAAILAHRAESIEKGVSFATQSEEDPAIAEAAIAAAIADAFAAKEASQLEKAVDMSIQSDPEDPAIAEAAIATAVATAVAAGIAEALAAKEASALEKSVDASIQSEPEDPSIAKAAVATAVAAGIAEALAARQASQLEKSVDMSIQSEPEDPSIAEAAIATAVADALAANKTSQLEKAVDMSIQSEPEDPSIAEATIATAVAAGIAEALAVKEASQLEKSVDVSIQSDPAMVEAALADAIAQALAAKEASQLEKSVDVSIQSEPEDPSIAEAAIATAVAEALATHKANQLEKSVDVSIQSEEDPAIAEAAIAAAVASALAVKEASQLEKAVDMSIQSDPEDPSIAEAAIAAAVTKALAAKETSQLEKAVDMSIQSDPEDPAIAEAAIAAAIASAFAAKHASQLEKSVDVSIQSDPEDPAIAQANVKAAIAADRAHSLENAVTTGMQSEPEDPKIAQDALDAAILASRAEAIEKGIGFATQSDPEDPAIAEAALAAAVAEALAVNKASQLEKSVDVSIQSEEDPAIAEAALAAAVASALAANKASQLEKSVDMSIQSDPEDPTIAEAALAAAVASALAAQRANALEACVDSAVQSESVATQDVESQVEIESVDTAVQSDAVKTIDSDTQYTLQSQDTFVQYEPLQDNGVSIGIQSQDKLTADQHTQSDQVESIQRGVQSDDTTKEASTVIPIVTEAHAKEDNMNDLLNEAPSSAPKDIQARSISDKSDKKDVQEHNNVSRSISAEAIHDDVPTKETETLLSDAQSPVQMYTKDEADALIAAAVATAIAKMAGSKDINAILSESRLVANEKKPVTMMNAHVQEDEKTHVRERDASILSKTSTAGFDDDDAELATGTAIVYSEEPSMEYRSFRKLSTEPSTTYNQDPLVAEPLPPLPRPELTMGTAAVFSQEPVDDIPARPSSPPPPALLSKATFSDIAPNKGKSPMSELASEEDLVQQRSLASPSYEKGTITSMSTTTSTHSMYDPETGASNPNMIGLITQTMIGDWLYKYTRKTVGNGISENRHQRYFWIHPYTRTLYWSTNAPGLNDHGGKAKSALIENIISVPDFAAGPSGLPNVSLLIQTSHRQLKLTAPTQEKHDLWFEAMSHLMQRQNTSIDSMRNRTVSSSASKQSRLHDLFGESQDDEDIEDVRMCCNGKHHVSKLEKDHLHRHSYRRRRSNIA